VTGSLLHRTLHHQGRLRPVWRLVLFFFFFFALSITGAMVLSFLPGGSLELAPYVMLTAAALGSGWILLAKVEGRPLGALGFALHSDSLREAATGTGLGAVLIAAAVLLLWVTGTAHFLPDAGTGASYAAFLGWTFLFFGIAAAFEEALFRGYPFQLLVEWIGSWPATLFGAAAFSIAHASNPGIGVIAFGNIFLAGILLSIAYLKTRSLWFATGVHLGWNWSMSSVFDFPVSGLEFDTPLYTAASVGADWWTGGGFGPEAGAAGTIALLAGTAWLIRTRQVGESARMRALGPIVDRRPEPGETR